MGRWLIAIALALMVGVIIKGQIDFNKLMASTKKTAGSL